VGLVLFHADRRTDIPRLEVSICFAKAPRKEIPEPIRNSFKILVVYSIAYSESFGQDNAHSEETTCPHTFNCHYMIYDFLYGMKQINSLVRDLLCSVHLWSLLLSMKRKLIQPLDNSSYALTVLMQCKV
jgi:hypothetical protein